MSRWECNSGHILEGLFYDPPRAQEGPAGMPGKIECPTCHSEMHLARAEGANLLIDRIRDFVSKASKSPNFASDASGVLVDLGQLEIVVKKLADEASRP